MLSRRRRCRTDEGRIDLEEDIVLRLCKSPARVEPEIPIANEYICPVVDCGARNKVEVRHKQGH